MQKELDGTTTKLSIRIAGVNGTGLEASNASFVEGRKLPWLQDTATENVWSSWGVEYRDVVILDAANHRVGVYNLTIHDLGNATNYAELKSLLIGAANAP